MAKKTPLIARTGPSGRRRYDPVTDRCRADNIYVRTNADGTKSRLSRGRWVSCSKQVKATKAYREAGGFGGAAEWDIVVSDTWVPPGDRAAKTRRVPVGAFFKSTKEIAAERRAARLAAVAAKQPRRKAVPKKKAPKKAPKRASKRASKGDPSPPMSRPEKLPMLQQQRHLKIVPDNLPKVARYSRTYDAGASIFPPLKLTGGR